jgi:phospholipid/cholesterol/gamma-HCH transport system substrate-binding protein
MSLLSQRAPRLVAVLLLVALAIAGCRAAEDSGDTHLTAEFADATGLHIGDDVKVLGVKVGEVTEVDPGESSVTVGIEVRDVDIPRGAGAAIVSPSLVSGRFVQLAPAYTKGPRLEDGARIPLAKTTYPVPFDDVKDQLEQLADALGPGSKAQRTGSLRAAITTVDGNLGQGNDVRLRHTLASLHAATRVLSDGRSDLFTTVRSLDSFSRNLVQYDDAVGGFSGQLSTATVDLAANRQVLAQSLTELGRMLPELERFVRAHGSDLTTTLGKVDTLAATVAGQANEVADLLHVVPHAVVDLAYTVQDQAVLGRAVLAQLDDLGSTVCGAILGVGGTAQTCRTALAPLLQILGMGTK